MNDILVGVRTLSIKATQEVALFDDIDKENKHLSQNWSDKEPDSSCFDNDITK